MFLREAFFHKHRTCTMYFAYDHRLYKEVQEHGDGYINKNVNKIFCLHGAEKDGELDNAADQCMSSSAQIVALVHKSIQSSNAQESEGQNGAVVTVVGAGNDEFGHDNVSLEADTTKQKQARPGPARSQTHDARIETKEANDSEASIEYARTEIAAMWREAIRLGDAGYQEHGSTIVHEALDRAQSTFRPFRNDAQAACAWIKRFEGKSIERLQEIYSGPSSSSFSRRANEQPIDQALQEGFERANTWS